MNNKRDLLKHSPFSVLFFGAFLIILIDQSIKHVVRKNGCFYVCNEGISFGFMVPPFVFWFISAIFLLIGIFFIRSLLQRGYFKNFLVLASLLVLGGAMSNCLDRLMFGCVFDYIFLFWKNMPIFNLADVSIFSGICILIFCFYKEIPQNRVQPVDKCC